MSRNILAAVGDMFFASKISGTAEELNITVKFVRNINDLLALELAQCAGHSLACSSDHARDILVRQRKFQPQAIICLFRLLAPAQKQVGQLRSRRRRFIEMAELLVTDMQVLPE